MPQAMDAAAVRRWSAACLLALDDHRDEIDRLNVFPVADADTGTNLLHTWRSAHAALHGVAADADVATAASALASGALLGSRGNSGVIVSQVLRGVAHAAVGAGPSLDAAGLRDALRQADAMAVAAVSDPAPGTLLTVLHAAAQAADVAADATVVAVAGTAAQAGAIALADTTGQLAALADAGVVDAGACGLVLLLDALVEALGGSAAPRSVAASPATTRPAVPTAPSIPASSATVSSATVSSAPSPEPPVARFEVMYLLAGSDTDRVADLRAALLQLGDSVTIAQGGPDTDTEADARGTVVHAVHVHTDDAGAAIELGMVAGRPHRIDVTVLDVSPPDAGHRGSASGSPGRPPVAERIVLAMTAGAAAAELFSAENATPVHWADDEAGAVAVLAAITAAGGAAVTLLPNGIASREVVRDLVHHARACGALVTVVPTASVVQGMAALAVHDPAREGEDDAVAMAEAAAGMRRGSLRIATERALTWAGQCEPGQALGLAGDEVVVLGEDAAAVLAELLDRLVGGDGELVTVLADPAADPGLLITIDEHLRRVHPGVELVGYAGDPGTDLLAIGVE